MKTHQTITNRLGILTAVAVVTFTLLLGAVPSAFGYAQCRNYNGGSPEQPATIYLGDTGTFGCDSWAQDGANWPRWQVVIKQTSDIQNGTYAGYGSFQNVQHKQGTSPRFTATGTWYWGMQLDYNGPGTGWYCNNDVNWNNMYGTPPGTTPLTITVSALTAPSGQTATAASSSSITLAWTRGVSGTAKDTLIFRSTVNITPTPVGGSVYNGGTDYTLGGNTYHCVSRDSTTGGTDSGLSANTTYYYFFFAENNTYYSAAATANATTSRTQNSTWDGGGADNNWKTEANWNPDGYPDANSATILHFAGSTRLNSTNNWTANSPFGQILFDSGASAFNLGGNDFNVYSTINNSSTSLQTINNNLTLGAATSLLCDGSGGLTIAGTIANGGFLLTVNNTNAVTLSGAISGVGALTKQTGSGLLKLAANNSYGGATTVSAGTLQLGNGSTTGNASSGQINLANGTTLLLNRSDAPTLANALNLSGAGGSHPNISVASSQTATLTNAITSSGGEFWVNDASNAGKLIVNHSANNFSVSVVVVNGVLEVGDLYTGSGTSSLGTKTPGIFLTGASSATLRYTGGNVAATALGQYLFQTPSSGSIIDVSQSSTTLTLSQAIGESGSGSGFTKLGAGTLSLTGNNSTYTFAGTVNVKEGTLLAANATSSTGSGTVAVQANAGNTAAGTLGGNGKVVGDVTVTGASSSILGQVYPAGSSAGTASTLTLGGSLTFNANSRPVFKLSSTSGGSNDKVVMNGASKTLTCGSVTVGIDCGATLDQTTDYVLFDLTGTSPTISGSFNAIPVFTGTTPANSGNYIILKVGNQIHLRYSSVSIVNSTATASPTTGVIADNTNSSTITVTARDSNNQLISGVTVTASSTGTGNTLSTPAVTDVNGQTTFTIVSTKAETKTITVSVSGVPITQQPTVQFVAGSAAKLAFTTQPGNGTGGSSLSAQPVVTVQDSNGNTVTSDSSSVTLAIANNAGPGGVLSGTATVAAVSGVATFSGLSINKIGSGYTLSATDGSLTTTTSSGFNITVGAAAKLAFTTQPGNGTGGSTLSTLPVVTVQDAGGNTVTSDTSTVTLAIANNAGPGGVLSGTLTKAAVAGVASFSANLLKIDKTGTGYTLSATDGSLTNATSSPFDITTGTATKLAYSVVPGTGTAGTPFSVTVQSQDAGGNPANLASSTTITLSKASGNGALSGTLAGSIGSGASSVTIATPVYSQADTMTLTATASGGVTLTAVTSGNIVFSAGAATKLQVLMPGETAAPGTASGKTGSPTSQLVGTAFTITVNAVDANWNLVSSTNPTVAITSSAASAVLPANAALTSGTKTFSVTLDSAGSQTVTATDIASALSPNTGTATTIGSITGTDNASSYGGTWANGNNHGAGFGAWILTPTPNSTYYGYFVGSSSLNGGSPQIDSSGNVSLGMYANTENTANALRPFNGVMLDNETFQVDFDSGDCYSTTVGKDGNFRIQLEDSSGNIRFEIYQISFLTDWQVIDGSGPRGTGKAKHKGKAHLALKVTGIDSYTATVTWNDGSTWTTGGTGTLGGTAGNRISKFRAILYNPQAIGSSPSGDAAQFNAFINNLQLSFDTTTTVASSANPSTYGDNVQFTAAVTPGFGGPPSGTVTFTIDGVAKATNSVTTSGTNATATYSTSSLTVNGGTAHTVSVAYSGDADFNSSSGSLSGSQTVNKASSSVGTPTVGNYTYNGSPQGPNSGSTATGSSGLVTYSYVGVSGTTYGPSATQPTGAGSYNVTATVAADANYNAASSSPAAFSIAKATPSVTVNVGSYTYSGSAQGPNSVTTPSSGSVTYSYVGVSGTTYTASATPPTGAGSYNVTATVAADSNYNGALSSATAFTISAKAASVTADAKTKTYGDVNPTLTATVVGGVNGDTINYTLATTAVQYSSVGTSNITVSLGSNPNYTVLTTNSTLTISAKAASVTADAKTKTYGDANPALTATVVGEVVGGAAINYTLGTDATQYSHIGTSNITVSLGSNPNYSVSATNSTLTISAKAASVTADAKTKTYGDANPTLTATVVGGVNGDTINYTLATTAVQYSSVGTSNITVSLGSNPNYSVSATNSTLTISAKAASVTADAKTKTYGDVNPALTATVVGQVIGGDTINYSLNTDAAHFSSVGTSNITVSLGSNPNYTVLTTNSTLTISAAALTITAQPNTKPYDGTTSATNTPVVTGLKHTDTVSGLAETYDTKNVGTGKTLSVSPYTVNDGNGGNNYTVSTVADTTGVISAAGVTITGVVAGDKVYDGTNTANLSGGTVSGAVSPDSVTFTAGTGAFASPYIGTQPVTASGYALSTSGVSTNYTLSAQPSVADATITAKELTVTGATVTSKAYDGNNAADITGATLNGVVSPDSITLGNDTSGTFADQYVGTGKSVATAPMTIAGDLATNYSLTQPVLTGSITNRPITVTAGTNTKVYDTTTSATNVPTLTVGTLASGDGFATLAEVYQDAAVATGKTLIPSATITNTAGVDITTNYALNLINDTTGVIVSACTAPNIIGGIDPGSATVTAFSPVVFALTNVTGTTPFAYQWRSNGVDIAGATYSSYTNLSVMVADAGNYQVVVANDCGSITSSVAVLTVNKATATVTLGSLSQTYDGTAKSASATTDPSGLTVDLTYAGSPNAPTNANTYQVIGTVVDANYQGSATNNLVIGKAAATVAAQAKTKTYGDVNPVLTAVTNGALNGDVINVTLTTDATQYSAVGTSNIFVNLGSNPNYNVTPTDSTLTIGKAAATFSLISSEYPVAGYKDSLTFTANNFSANAGGTVQFKTNGVNLGSPVTISGGSAVSSASVGLPRATTNVVAAIYSGDNNYLSLTQTLTQIVTNHPPVAINLAILRTPGLSLHVALTNLSAHWSDGDGDLLTLTGVAAQSTNHINLKDVSFTLPVASNVASFTNGFVGYTNGPNVNDRFTYTISDGYDTATGLVEVIVNTAPIFGQNTETLVPNNLGHYVLTFYGVPGINYWVQSNSVVSNPNTWVDVYYFPATVGAPVTNIDLGPSPAGSGYFRLRYQP